MSVNHPFRLHCLLTHLIKLEVYYSVNYTTISLVFLAPFIGYTLAAILNNRIHVKFGQLGAAVIGPSCKIICYAVTCAKPPYAVLPVIFVFSGFGIGLLDGAFNAWVGNMEHANEYAGFSLPRHSNLDDHRRYSLTFELT